MKDEPEARRNFKDQTYWNARVRTDAEGKSVVSFQLADNLTEWNVTARAITADTRVGAATASFVARKDLQINAGVPPYMLEGREQIVAASLSNLTNQAQSVTVSLTIENGRIRGESRQTVQVEAGRQSVASFAVQPGEGANLKLRFQASAGGLSDASEYTIGLRPFGLKRTLAAYAILPEDERGAMELNLPENLRQPTLPLRLNPGSGAALRQSPAYLADSPYGRIEQTMSRFLPLLAANQAGYVTPRLRAELPRMVEAGLGRLRQFQNTDGGFGWYGGMETSDPLMTAYVYRGLALARKLGQNFEDRLIVQASAYLYRTLKKKRQAEWRIDAAVAGREGGPAHTFEESYQSKLADGAQ